MGSESVSKRSALTFDEWAEHGYRVRAGMKSAGRNKAGKATFTMKQVWFVPENKRDIYLTPPSNEPPKEIKKSLAAKAKADEDRHNHMANDFRPELQSFTDDDEPPW